MKQIISALFLCMLLSGVPRLQAQNIQLHYDFGRSLYCLLYTSRCVYETGGRNIRMSCLIACNNNPG